MKRLICVGMIMLFLFCANEALAAKARSITTNADSDYHDSHLALHIGDINCHGTGNYVKIRTQAGGDKIVGHLEQADAFNLVDVQNGWALIQITTSASTSPDSQAGMTGWVDADYIDCNCSDTEYYSGNANLNSSSAAGVLLPSQWNTYQDVLDTYYYVASEKVTGIVNEPQMREIENLLGVLLEPTMYPSLNAGYIIRDLNGDGIDELIILFPSQYEESEIITLYTLENNRPKLLLYGANRSRYCLAVDGGIVNYGSDGADYSRYYVFDIVGTKLVVRGVIISDVDNSGNVCYFYTTDTDLDTTNDIPVDEDYAMHHKFAEEDHNPQGFISFAEYGNR